MEGHKHECLNCGAALISNYCHDCGQKSDTHRITLSHLVKHDLVHGLWHFDKGLLYTLKESFLHPGHMAMDYISGKRIKYYNVFYLILIVIGINALTVHYFKAYHDIKEVAGPTGLVMKEDSVDITYFVSHYFKLMLFLLIPFFALSGLVSFYRLKLNFAEHFIIAGSLLLASAIWAFIAIVCIYSFYNIESKVVEYAILGIITIACLQPVRVYYQATRRIYTNGGFAWRVLLWYVSLFILLLIVVLSIALLSGKNSIVLS